jgi:hypothetical protein
MTRIIGQARKQATLACALAGAWDFNLFEVTLQATMPHSPVPRGGASLTPGYGAAAPSGR